MPFGPDPFVTIPFTCSDVETFDVGGVANTSTSQSGNDGDILYDCLYDNVSSKFALDSAIPSLNVVDVTKVESADISCSDGSSAKGNITYNYKSGIVNIAATLDGQVMN